jgi:two-component system, cell cycle response regulator
VADDWEEAATSSTELSEIRQQLAPSSRTQPCLTVLTGSAAGQQFKLASGALVIGRGSAASIRVEDDGISRAHANVRVDGNRAWIEDAGSRNGTFVNGQRITATTELIEGDKIQVGRSTVLRFGFQDELDASFHENLLSSALRDGLTKLFNKRYFLERLDSELKFAIRHKSSVSLLVLDLDHFKQINDTRGHLAGDAVLARLSEVVVKAVRNEDVVARFGGEELVIILRAISLEGALQMAERLRKLIEQTQIPFDGMDIRATVSIGAAGYPSSPVTTPAQLVEAAGPALYRAKHGGRNRVSL